MLLFWLLSSLMVLAALALVVPSLLRGRAARHAAPGDANVALYRERLEELERERDRGEVDSDRYAALREDLERGLLSDAGGREAERAAAGPPAPGMAVAVAVSVPAASLALYLWLGSPHGVESRAPPPRDMAAATEDVPSVEAMVASLADRLANDPDDAEGWLLLARSQVILERHDAALAGFRRAHALLGDEPALLADWAEAEAAADGNRFTAAALGRLERALELDPDHEKALWLGGFAAAQDGRVDIAVARWERLLANQPPDSREASIVSELLARIRAMDSGTTTAAGGETDSAAPATAASDAGNAGGARIVVEVSLSPDLAAGTGDGEPVFVFARAPGGAGPPLAVARTVTGALPAVIVLDESSAMVPSRSLAGVERVMVTARVARSGTVTRTAGDLEGTFGPVDVADSGPVGIVISRVVP